MKAVVTGAAGFIGSHLVDRLLDLGLEVAAVDNLATGRMGNLAQAAQRRGFSFLQADVADHQAMLRAMDGAGWIFHLAGLADIVPSIQNPLEYHRANVDGTASVLEAARRTGVRRFVYAASASCYGVPEVYPTPEEAPIRLMYPYALSKYVGEEYLLHWVQTYGLPGISLRLFNIYGPRSRTTGAYGAVFGVFLAQKLAGRPYTVVGDGNQSRDFTFVSDTVEAFVLAAQSDFSGEVFNVGAGAPQSVNRLVELLGGEKTHIPKRPGEPDCTWADIRRIRERLGWEPRVPFAEGVRIMLEHIGLWKDAPVWTEESISEATRDWFGYLGK